ncbi:unnamed protein product [Chrysodeixis includens]|uniref:Uncharacterized protein n=1 Tax=Chrysodeixis includens TaxID=689277 RepID=A0A9N8L0A2_CHRIL|nr:unnamed protein product [Chrysodeixis includens]
MPLATSEPGTGARDNPRRRGVAPPWGVAGTFRLPPPQPSLRLRRPDEAPRFYPGFLSVDARFAPVYRFVYFFNKTNRSDASLPSVVSCPCCVRRVSGAVGVFAMDCVRCRCGNVCSASCVGDGGR